MRGSRVRIAARLDQSSPDGGPEVNMHNACTRPADDAAGRAAGPDDARRRQAAALGGAYAALPG